MKQKVILIIALLALVSLMIVPVCAETLTGDISSSGIESTNYYKTGTNNNGDEWRPVIKNVESTEGATYWVHFDYTGTHGTFDGSAPNSASTSIVFTTTGGRTIATGTVGFQRLFDNAFPTPNEIEGYQYIIFDTWNVSGLSGDLSTVGGSLTLVYNASAVYHMYSGATTSCATFTNAPTGYFYLDMGSGGFARGTQSGTNTFNRDVNFASFYSATKPAGLGISGFVNKYSMGDPATKYNSRAYIVDATTNLGLTSEGVISDDSFNFTVPAQSIIVALRDSMNVWHNSSVLFAATVPTVTPTPITTIPPGYIQTRVHLMDNGGNPIHGGNIYVLDVEANVWTNSTNDVDGILYVNTLPYHTLNIYGSFTLFPNEFLPNELLGQETGYEGGYVYWLTLYPYESNAPPGQTSLYVEVRDAQTHYIVTYSVVRIDYNGESYAQNTANSPSALFLVPNNTIIHATASKLGYNSGTIVTNSSPASTKTVTIELSKSTVTPTITTTIPPGGTTPAVTVDPHDPGLTGSTNAKGQEMMNWLAMNGMQLVQLCFFVTILALLGVKLGGK